MGLDIRIPIGIMFGIIGVLLTAYGLGSGQLSLGINMDLWWGGALTIFGVVMLLLARSAAAR